MNKFMKKIMKKSEGFTLVELIVVIAILAILAGVAIPVYSGYINSANKTADNQLIEAVETAMSAALAMEGDDADDAANCFTAEFNTTTKVLTIAQKTGNGAAANAADVWDNFTDFYGDDVTVELKFYDAGANIPAMLNVQAVDAGA